MIFRQQYYLKKKKLITSLNFTAFLSTLKTIKCSSYLTVGHLKCNSHHLFHWIRNCLYCFAYGCKKIVLVQAYIFLWKWYKISIFCSDTTFSWIVDFSLGSFVLVVGQCVAGISNAGKTPFVDRTDSGTGWWSIIDIIGLNLLFHFLITSS